MVLDDLDGLDEFDIMKKNAPLSYVNKRNKLKKIIWLHINMICMCWTIL